MLTTDKTRRSAPALIAAFAAGDLRSLAERIARRWRGQDIAYISREHYAIPDSAVCNAALALASSCSPGYLLNHALRSHALGCCMAHKVGKPFDREVFFIGSILHDLGLTSPYDTGKPFELDGAHAAREFCIAHGLGSDGADLVHEMIALHDSVGVAHRREPEVALLHFGSGLDVAGLFIHDVHEKTLANVLEIYPGLGFRAAFSRLIEEQARRKPGSYIAGLASLGFAKKICRHALPCE